MTALAPMLAILFMLDPEVAADREVASVVSADADRGYEATNAGIEIERKMRIVSHTGDFDRAAGVAMFEGGVQVSYGDECTLSSDRLFVFLVAGTNRLDRIVAVGNVAITNAARVGTCALARFRRLSGEIDMFGNEDGVQATFSDGVGGQAVAGRRIRFWLDTEQVEVERSTIRADASGGKAIL